LLCRKGYLSTITEGERTRYQATAQAAEYIALFSRLYQSLFDTIPGFKL